MYNAHVEQTEREVNREETIKEEIGARIDHLRAEVAAGSQAKSSGPPGERRCTDASINDPDGYLMFEESDLSSDEESEDAVKRIRAEFMEDISVE